MSTNEKVDFSVAQMKKGDMILFAGEKGDWLSEAIMILTNSPVSHSALYMNTDPAMLADAALSGLHEHLVKDGTKGEKGSRYVYICRLKDESLDLTPVVDAGMVYVRQNLPYPKAELVLLAVILLYKKVSNPGIAQSVVIKIFRVVIAWIKELMDEIIYKGQRPMVCSEFVFQSYLDGSKVDPQLKLILKNGDMQGSLTNGREESLLEHTVRYVEGQNEQDLSRLVQSAVPVSESPEELGKQLLDSMEEDGHDLYAPNDELSQVVLEFLQVRHQLMTGEQANSLDIFKELIANERKMQAFFVTPGDLLQHITNAHKLGTFYLWRDDQSVPVS